mmetsp:Transcript_31195/g.99624  ORF Transcript_31195/g.99624 Transcript_31195/m.99624 type:complete len:335 (+) Transcript_31195:313-1317(+)
MHYLAFVAIFARPVGTRSRRYEAMLADAITAAASPHALLALVDKFLVDRAAHLELVQPPAAPAPARHTSLPVAAIDAKIAAKACHYARAGERGQAWQALSPAIVADTSLPAVRRAFAQLTPQSTAPLPPDLLADIPDTPPLLLDRAKFDKAIATAPRLRAPGTLYDTYETYTTLARFGARDGLYSLASAACAGHLHPEIVDVLTCLRAVALYKDDECTAIRPLGIGEVLRRIIGRCFAAQERGRWARFFTEPLPEDAALNEAKIKSTAAVSAVARAAYEAAATAASPDAAALGTQLTRALEEQFKATVTPRYPVNYAFSRCGAAGLRAPGSGCH